MEDFEVKETQDQLVDRLISINRVAKVVKGGRRFRFSALVVVGDGNGTVGYGLGKAREVPEAIRKAVDKAKREVVKVPIMQGTIPHEVIGEHGATKVLLLPASPGTGVIAGSTVRAVVESVGIHNVLTKIIGSSNPHNVVKATIKALMSLSDPQEVSRRRGKEITDYELYKSA
ncbi:MAG: 30S ribosomal protein S5 [Proteobacteria bacterium]|nr:30S ribosomal protein S5 [Pseudomonadota bacterium]